MVLRQAKRLALAWTQAGHKLKGPRLIVNASF